MTWWLHLSAESSIAAFAPGWTASIDCSGGQVLQWECKIPRLLWDHHGIGTKTKLYSARRPQVFFVTLFGDMPSVNENNAFFSPIFYQSCCFWLLSNGSKWAGWYLTCLMPATKAAFVWCRGSDLQPGHPRSRRLRSHQDTGLTAGSLRSTVQTVHPSETLHASKLGNRLILDHFQRMAI